MFCGGGVAGEYVSLSIIECRGLQCERASRELHLAMAHRRFGVESSVCGVPESMETPGGSRYRLTSAEMLEELYVAVPRGRI
jgi:hypothetical protein